MLLTLFILLALALFVPCTLEGSSNGRVAYSWAVKLSSASTEADRLAKECGVVNLGAIGKMSNLYEFGLRETENGSGLPDRLAVEGRLASNPAVQWATIQRPLKRVVRSFRDPYFLKQWHLVRNPDTRMCISP